MKQQRVRLPGERYGGKGSLLSGEPQRRKIQRLRTGNDQR